MGCLNVLFVYKYKSDSAINMSSLLEIEVAKAVFPTPGFPCKITPLDLNNFDNGSALFKVILDTMLSIKERQPPISFATFSIHSISKKEI